MSKEGEQTNITVENVKEGKNQLAEAVKSDVRENPEMASRSTPNRASEQRNRATSSSATPSPPGNGSNGSEPVTKKKSQESPAGNRKHETYLFQEMDRIEREKLEKEFKPQSLDVFIKQVLPPKEALIEGVLFKRDLIALLGRRREGKTTLVCNIALAGALGHPEFLGFRIPKPFNVLAFYLEDDPAELQVKLNRMINGDTTNRFHLYTRDDFHDRRIQIDIRNGSFMSFVQKACDECHPDLIIFDNLAHLLSGDYNNSKKVHELMMLCYKLRKQYGAAILIAAHPRKASRLNDSPMGTRNIVSLFSSPQLFFEECMGSSHFINSTGSLWGIERDYQTDRTRLLLGAQRFTGDYTRTLVEKKDNDWFERVEDDLGAAKGLVLTTKQRKQAWDFLPDGREFSQAEARESVKPALKSNGSFQPWWEELLRHGLLIPVGNKVKKASQKAS